MDFCESVQSVGSGKGHVVARALEKAAPVEENEWGHRCQNHDSKDPRESAILIDPGQSADVHSKDSSDQGYGEEIAVRSETI